MNEVFDIQETYRSIWTPMRARNLREEMDREIMERVTELPKHPQVDVREFLRVLGD